MSGEENDRPGYCAHYEGPCVSPDCGCKPTTFPPKGTTFRASRCPRPVNKPCAFPNCDCPAPTPNTPYRVKTTEELDAQFELFGKKPRKFEPEVRDMVNLPAHYNRFPLEPMRIGMENRLNPLQFNINKYSLRAEYKHADNGLEDLLKVVRCAIMYAKFLAGDPDWWRPYRNAMLADALKQEMTYADPA